MKVIQSLTSLLNPPKSGAAKLAEMAAMNRVLEEAEALDRASAKDSADVKAPAQPVAPANPPSQVTARTEETAAKGGPAGSNRMVKGGGNRTNLVPRGKGGRPVQLRYDAKEGVVAVKDHPLAKSLKDMMVRYALGKEGKLKMSEKELDALGAQIGKIKNSINKEQASLIEPDMSTAAAIAPKLYCIQDVDGKGRGLIATQDIAAGTVITHSPMLVFPAGDPLIETASLASNYLWRWQFDEAGNWDENNPALAMLLGDGNLMNHEMASNCLFDLDGATKMHTIYAGRDIKAGEELAINYGWYGSEEEYAAKWQTDSEETAAKSGPSKAQRLSAKRRNVNAKGRDLSENVYAVVVYWSDKDPTAQALNVASHGWGTKFMEGPTADGFNSYYASVELERGEDPDDLKAMVARLKALHGVDTADYWKENDVSESSYEEVAKGKGWGTWRGGKGNPNAADVRAANPNSQASKGAAASNRMVKGGGNGLPPPVASPGLMSGDKAVPQGAYAGTRPGPAITGFYDSINNFSIRDARSYLAYLFSTKGLATVATVDAWGATGVAKLGSAPKGKGKGKDSTARGMGPVPPKGKGKGKG